MRKSYVDSTLSHWVLMRLHIIRKTERDRSKQSTSRRICPPPSPPSLQQTHIHKLKLLRMEFYITTKAGYKVLEKVEDNRWDTQRTEAMGERIMWTALFFPLGFDEVAHDSGRRKRTYEGRTLRYLTSQSPTILLQILLVSRIQNHDGGHCALVSSP